MFSFFKKASVVNSQPRPEVELRQTFEKLQSANALTLTALHMSVNHLYEVLGMDDRLIELISVTGAEYEKRRLGHFAHLEKIFQMEKSLADKGMNTESVAVKLIARWYACRLVGGTLKESFSQQDAMRIFDHFKQTRVIDLDPPRRSRMPPS